MNKATTIKEKKDCLFQYATRFAIYEDTELITRVEAEELWSRWIEHVKDNWDEDSSPEMCIWINCETNTDYHTKGKDIDFIDCELRGGRFYRTKRKVII